MYGYVVSCMVMWPQVWLLEFILRAIDVVECRFYEKLNISYHGNVALTNIRSGV